MANTSIGRLNVILSASASDFDKAINGAEKRLTGFAAKAGTLGGLTTIGKSLGSMVTTPLETLINPLGSLASLPGAGLAAMSAGLNDVSEATRRSTTYLRDLEREANRVGIATAKYRGLQLFAGGDADQLPSMLGKMTKMLGELRAGDRTIGNESSIGQKLGRFMDVSALSKADPLEAFKMIIDAAHKTGDEIDRNTVLFTAFGKAGLAAAGMAKDGIEEIEASMTKAAKLYSPGASEIAGQIKKAGKEIDQLKQANDMQSMYAGFPALMADKAWEKGDIGTWASEKSKSMYRQLEMFSHWVYKSTGSLSHQGKSPSQLWLDSQSPGPTERDAMSEIGKAAFGANESLKTFNETLKEQIGYLGVSADEAAVWKATLKSTDIDEINEAWRLFEDRERRVKAKAFTSSAATPLDQLATRFNDLSAVISGGDITNKVANASIAKLVADAERLGGGRLIGSSPVLAQSQEAARLLDMSKAQPSINSAAELKAALERMLAAQNEGNKTQEKILTEMKNNGRMRVVSSP